MFVRTTAGERRPGLVEIEYGDARPPTARLLRWDDAAQAAMPRRLDGSHRRSR
jgi:hypothetical protein